ncbi:MAG: dimethylsulfonioproprionate lyase family protein [Bryobacteraceae bacterium]
MDPNLSVSLPEDQSEIAALLALTTPVRPPVGVRDRVMAAAKPVGRGGFQDALPGYAILKREERLWTQTPFDGVEVLTLAYDKQTSIATNLLRMAPGSVYPNHHHSVGEQCWVIEGDLRQVDGSMSVRAGDFFLAKPGTDHGAITTETGCLLLIVSSARDYVRG